MNKREMLEQRARQDVLVSRNPKYKECSKKIRDLEADRFSKDIPTSDDDYYEKLLSEVA